MRFGAQLSPTVSWMTSDHSKVLGGGVDVGLKVGAQAEFGFAENYFFTVGIGFGLNEFISSKFEDDRNIYNQLYFSIEL